MSEDDQLWLMSSDAGYGFICKGSDMVSKNRNGKALLTVPESALVMTPQEVTDLDSDDVLVITNEGRMLIFPISELPHLSKGKGNKIINIPAARSKAREEMVSHLVIMPTGSHVTLHAGKRKLGLKPSDLDNFRGERGRRGAMLPRGLQRATDMEISSPNSEASDE